MPRDYGNKPRLVPRRYCSKHNCYMKLYLDGTEACRKCLQERIAEIHGRGGKLQEDI